MDLKHHMGDGHTAVTDFLIAMQTALGWKTFCIDGIPWCRFGGTTAMTIPLSEVYPVGSTHVERILRESRCLLAQFPTAAHTGIVSKQYVLRDKAYAEASLQRQFRQMVRRGEKQLTFRELTWDELATAGPRVVDASRSRLGIRMPVANGTWREACAQGESSGQFVVFGCLLGHELAGFAIFWRQPAGFRTASMAVDPHFFPLGAANLLLYRSGRDLIARSDSSFVSFGRSGIPEVEGNSRFKRHAGLLAEPLHMAAILHPRLRWLGHMEKSTSWCSALRAVLGPNSRVANHLEALAAAAATNPDLLPK